MEYKLHHFGILGQDMDQSLRTYRDYFGQTLTSRWYNMDHLDIAFLGKGSQATMEIVAPPHLEYETAHIQRHGYSLNHLAFLVDDAQEAFEDLSAKGVRVAWEPFLMDDVLGLCQCAFYDEDDVLFEVFSYPKGKPMALPEKITPKPKDLRLHHVNILTPDIRRSQRFYEEKLGMKTVIEGLEDEGGSVFLVDPSYDYRESDFLLQIVGPPHLEPREEVLLEKRGACLDHMGFVADDLQGAWDAAITRGAKHVTEPIFYLIGNLAWFVDPDGIDVEIMNPFPEDLIQEAIRTGNPLNVMQLGEDNQ